MDFDGTSLLINFHQKESNNKKEISKNVKKNINLVNIQPKSNNLSRKRKITFNNKSREIREVNNGKPPQKTSFNANKSTDSMPLKRYRPLMTTLEKMNNNNISNKPKTLNPTNIDIPQSILFDKEANLDNIDIINEKLRIVLKKYLNSNQLTVVQRLSWSTILKGNNTLIKSPSGSGKTLAFVVPILERLIVREPKINRKDGVYAIILVPTKELAKQLSDILMEILRNFIWIVPGGLYGCDKRKAEKMRLRKGLNIIVATPGRLHDHLVHTQCLDFRKLEWFVVDEADLLLDMGYEQKFQDIKNCIPKHVFDNCQKIFLSATLSKKFSSFFAQIFDKKKIFFVDAANECVTNESDIINIDYDLQKHDINEDHSLEKVSMDMINPSEFNYPENLKQKIIEIPTKLRLIALVWLIKHIIKIQTKDEHDATNIRVIIFFSNIASADFHCQLFQQLRNEIHPSSSSLNAQPIKLLLLHGSMEIKERIHVYDLFSKCNKSILFTTDVAARGLDFPLVDWIIQFNPARETKEYVHRVGRACRMGNSGNAILFLESHEMPYVDLLHKSQLVMEQLTLNSLYKNIAVNLKNMENDATSLFTSIRSIVSTNELYNIALSAYNATIRAYTSYPRALKQIFNLRNLHQGHLAESFGIKEKPKEISALIKNPKLDVNLNNSSSRFKTDKLKLNLHMNKQSNRSLLKSTSALLSEEFQGGVVSGPRTRKSRVSNV